MRGIVYAVAWVWSLAAGGGDSSGALPYLYCSSYVAFPLPVSNTFLFAIFYADGAHASTAHCLCPWLWAQTFSMANVRGK